MPQTCSLCPPRKLVWNPKDRSLDKEHDFPNMFKPLFFSGPGLFSASFMKRQKGSIWSWSQLRITSRRAYSTALHQRWSPGARPKCSWEKMRDALDLGEATFSIFWAERDLMLVQLCTTQELGVLVRLTSSPTVFEMHSMLRPFFLHAYESSKCNRFKLMSGNHWDSLLSKSPPMIFDV